MEVYFSGTIERIIFENPSNFYRILLLEIDDTDAEDFDDFEIIVTGTMADVIEAARGRGELRYQDILKGPIRLEDVFAEAVSRADRGAAA